MLAHPHQHDHVADLTGERRAVADQLLLAERPPAAATSRRPVIDYLVGIGDHLTVVARMAGLAPLPSPRGLGRSLRRARRIARRRPRAVARGHSQAALELVHLLTQGRDLLGLGDQHQHRRLRARRYDPFGILALHTPRIRPSPTEPSL